MKVIKLIPEGVRIDLTDDEVMSLLDILHGAHDWLSVGPNLRREIKKVYRTPATPEVRQP
jgi:hypothetical protein